VNRKRLKVGNFPTVGLVVTELDIDNMAKQAGLREFKIWRTETGAEFEIVIIEDVDHSCLYDLDKDSAYIFDGKEVRLASEDGKVLLKSVVLTDAKLWRFITEACELVDTSVKVGIRKRKGGFQALLSITGLGRNFIVKMGGYSFGH